MWTLPQCFFGEWRITHGSCWNEMKYTHKTHIHTCIQLSSTHSTSADLILFSLFDLPPFLPFLHNISIVCVRCTLHIGWALDSRFKIVHGMCIRRSYLQSSFYVYNVYLWLDSTSTSTLTLTRGRKLEHIWDIKIIIIQRDSCLSIGGTKYVIKMKIRINEQTNKRPTDRRTTGNSELRTDNRTQIQTRTRPSSLLTISSHLQKFASEIPNTNTNRNRNPIK